MSVAFPRKNIVRDLTEGNVVREILSFAAPLFLSSLMQTAYNLTDMAVIGHWVGKNGLSAVTVGGDIVNFMSFVAIGATNAGQVIISQFIGAKQTNKVRRMIGTMFSVMLATAILLCVLALIFQKQLLGWVNTPPEALEYTEIYVATSLLGLIFVYGYNTISAILRGMGDSFHPFLFIAVATILNVLLDFLLVIVFRMAVFGVALATILSQGMSFFVAAWFLYHRRAVFGFDFKWRSFAVDRESFMLFVKLGVPMVLQSASIHFSMLFVNSWINSYGLLPSVMTGIGNKVSSVVNVVNIALSTAGSTMIGQCIGAEKYHRVPRVLGVSFIINLVIAGAAGSMVFFFPLAVFGIFTTESDVLQLALTYVPVTLLLFGGSALRPPMSSLINGSGNFKLNFAVAIFDGVVMRIGLSLALGLSFGFGVYGFWYGSALASFTPFFIGGVFFLSGRWKTRKYIIEE